MLGTGLAALAVALLALPATASPTLVDAARTGDDAAALFLLAQGADPNAAEPNGSTPLLYAAHRDDAALAAALLRAHADPGKENLFGATPMQEAAENGDAKLLEMLLAAGADVESPSREGQTALMVAARTGKLDAVRLLLKRGAKVNAVEGWGGQTALMWAAGQCHPDIVRELIKRGADVNARGADRNWTRRVHSEPRPKDMGRGGFTPLIYAARADCVGAAKELVNDGADLDKTDPDRGTPLVLALMNLSVDTAAYLVEAGADVDKWDLYGQNPVYMAVDMNIIPDGGRPDVPSLDKTTGLDVLKMLLDRGANPNLQLKLRPPYRNVIFDRGGDPILATGATPLLRAAKASDNDAIRLLLAHGALVDLPNETGVTPLMAAAGMGHGANPTRGRYKTEEQGVESIRLLIAAGANVNARNAQGQTALHAAAQHGWTEIVRLLAGNGADLQAKDNKGVTPLDIAQGHYTADRLSGPAEAHPETAAALQALIAAG
jgi:ankyrin repeat protein